MKWGPIYSCPALRMQEICEIICRVPRKWTKSKFLYRDAIVMSVADKCIVVSCFVFGSMTIFSWRRESSLTTWGSQKMDLCLVVTECLSHRFLPFRTSAIAFIHFKCRLRPTDPIQAICTDTRTIMQYRPTQDGFPTIGNGVSSKC